MISAQILDRMKAIIEYEEEIENMIVKDLVSEGFLTAAPQTYLSEIRQNNIQGVKALIHHDRQPILARLNARLKKKEKSKSNIDRIVAEQNDLITKLLEENEELMIEGSQVSSSAEFSEIEKEEEIEEGRRTPKFVIPDQNMEQTQPELNTDSQIEQAKEATAPNKEIL